MGRKKGSKKTIDDDVWADNDNIEDPIAAALAKKGDDSDKGSDAEGGGGLMSIISKSKKKKKGGKPLKDSFAALEIEDFDNKPSKKTKDLDFENSDVSDYEPKVAKKGKKNKKQAPISYAEDFDEFAIPEPKLPAIPSKKDKANAVEQVSKKQTKQPVPTPAAGKKGGHISALQKMVEAQRAAEEEARRLLEEKKRLEEEEAKRIAEEEREAKRKQEAFLQQLKDSGVSVPGLKESTPEGESTSNKPKRVTYTDRWEALLESSEDEDEAEKEATNEPPKPQRKVAQRKREATARRANRMKAAMDARTEDNLRSPICVILGHVDTGKTKLLDRIRQTDVQGGEAGGITQQIGATYFPSEAIIKKTAVVNKEGKLDIRVPGLLIIDTPGHESFTNLRSRGSSLCNIAILVVDIMHGLEPQTLESMRLLRDRKTPFVVALNKIDRIYNWKPTQDNGFRLSLKNQEPSVQREFNDRVQSTILAFAEQGLNSKLYYENKNFAKNVSLVPTSAITGEGIPDLLALLVGLTQTRMSSQLMYLSELEATVLEVKVIEGLGTTIDVVLSNGVLNEGDRIVLCGLDGPIVTNIRALLTPQPMRELRVKSAYVHHKSIKAAMGVKISAPGLEKAIAGSRLMVVGPEDDEEELMDEVMSDLTSLQDNIDKSGKGVWVQASTLGSLEALLEFMRTSKIPVSGINIGPVHRKDVFRASSMLERAKEFAVMLCFDVKVEKEALDYAEEIGMKVFTADIIYHLFDSFTAYNKEMLETKRKDQAPQAVFPCVLKMIPGAAFNKRDPIIIGVDVVEGQMRLGTPICVVNLNAETKQRETITLGKITSMEINHKPVTVVKRGESGAGVAVKIECPSYETPKLFGRHFDEKNELYSKVSRQSIDILKESFRDDLTKEEWALVIKLKKILDIQ
ncbi:hypothetical protein BB559_005842 [Furculomyces boomerangus]|uniref:Eukaryotic translation initiation factor 5B n=1 Tax=Furculomyces boomerangus TaxID=61424 RepID=A0A2T9Y695_9FUNG|nr:hypothetical protein BB559_005842 [Furculomyces boomerangus]